MTSSTPTVSIGQFKTTNSYVMVGPNWVNLVVIRKIDELNLWEDTVEDRGEPMEALEEVNSFEDVPTRIVKIGSVLKGDVRAEFINFLIK